MTSLDRARLELVIAGLDPAPSASPIEEGKNAPQNWMGRDVMELLDVFAKQGHSGASAPLIANLFYRLVRGEVLTPLQGTADEWMDQTASSGGNPTFQNKRCFSIFAADASGKDAVNVAGRIFIDKNGAAFSQSKRSSTPVTFPCIPVTEYIREGTPEAEPFADVFQKDAPPSDEAAD